MCILKHNTVIYSNFSMGPSWNASMAVSPVVFCIKLAGKEQLEMLKSERSFGVGDAGGTVDG